MGASALALARAALTSCGIAAVEGDPGPGDGEIGIFLHGRAPVVVAALEIEILVVGHSLFVELAGFGGRSRDRQRGGFTLLDVVRKQRRGETETES